MVRQRARQHPAISALPIVDDHGDVAKTPRGFETVRDMVLSMAVVGAVVAGLFLVVVWQRPEVQGSITPVVDVDGVIAQVQVSGPFTVRQPSDLPEGWTPTSARFEDAAESGALGGSVMHIGYVTPDGSYAEVKQTDAARDVALSEWVDGAVVDGTQEPIEIAGVTWRRAVSADTGKMALYVTTDDDPAVLVVVTGKADWPELEQLAASLDIDN